MGVQIIPLGGLGEFGANSLLLEHDGGRLAIDAGAAFTDLEAFGVGYEVPDFAALGDSRPDHVVFTHAHEDHVKGIAFLQEAFPDVVPWGSRATLARLRELVTPQQAAVGELTRNLRTEIAGFDLDVLPVSHSIPGSLVLRLQADSGTLVHATDLRLAPSALGEETSLEALGRWGEDGVDLLLLDGTNAFEGRVPPSEKHVGETIAELVRGVRGAVVAVTFASHIGRYQQLARAALAAGRVVVPVGRGLIESLDVQASLGGLALPLGLVRRARELPELPHDRLLIVATGSQGEAGSAFSRLAVDVLPGFHLEPGDTVLHCARVIPGSERRLAHLFDHCVRRGARVVTASEAPIHASGHAHRAELVQLIDTLRPRRVLPVHGRRRNLEEVADLARHHGASATVVENGEELRWGGPGLEATGERRGVGRVLIDDVGEEVLDPIVLRDRRIMAQEGLVVAVLTCTRGHEAPAVPPELHAFGLELDDDTRRKLAADLAIELCRGGPLARQDTDWLRSTMSQRLRSELRRRTRRRPAVVALVTEL